MIGTTFGNYRIDSKLGAGGMGVVYKAFDTELDRPVAIKTLLSADSDDPSSLARFLREAKAASRLQHSAIVTIHHFGVEGDTRYIVMEFVEGKTLKKLIGANPLPVPQFCDIAIQVVDALALAHEKGVIHRDLKAENVMVTPRGQAKILDFGLAKLREPETPNPDAETVFKTQAGLVIGTVSHMSPEQAMGKEVDARADIFSIGVVLYEMATGTMPFEAPTPQATLARVLDSEPTPVLRLNPDAPPEMERLIHQCLNKNKAFRPDASELLVRLKAIQALVATDPLATAVGVLPAATPGSGGVYIPGYSSEPAAATADYRTPSTAYVPGVSRGGSSAIAALPPAAASTRTIYNVVRGTRRLLSLVLWILPLAYFLYFIIGGGLIRQQAVEGTVIMGLIRALVVPVMQWVDSVFTVRMVSGGWNFMVLVLGFAAIVLRFVLLLPVETVEQKLRIRLDHASGRPPSRVHRV
ncbi:MAG: protein kinase [Acidobacteria bacterium]|nr:protein kinase [Acidobacteriota bacterium]